MTWESVTAIVAALAGVFIMAAFIWSLFVTTQEAHEVKGEMSTMRLRRRRRRFEVQPWRGEWRLMEGQVLLATSPTKKPLEVEGARQARAAAPAQLLIKRRNGTIADERTYGNDPHPPRG